MKLNLICVTTGPYIHKTVVRKGGGGERGPSYFLSYGSTNGEQFLGIYLPPFACTI